MSAAGTVREEIHTAVAAFTVVKVAWVLRGKPDTNIVFSRICGDCAVLVEVSFPEQTLTLTVTATNALKVMSTFEDMIGVKATAQDERHFKLVIDPVEYTFGDICTAPIDFDGLQQYAMSMQDFLR